MATIGIPGLILILVIALVIFGPKKLPEIGRAAGSTLKEFKNSTNGLTNDDKDETKSKETDKTAEADKTIEANKIEDEKSANEKKESDKIKA